MPNLEGKVAIVTGAGRGIGREHALALAEAGARVVVNDLGAGLSGEGHDDTPAQQVVQEIVAKGGEAAANGENVADFAGAERLVAQAIDGFGRLDILVNNAGILRDRMIVNMTESEWDSVIAVHLKGHFAPTRHAAAYWRAQAKAGEQVRGRVINTSSPSGVFGNVGQSNYGAAKAGIAGFTLIVAQELQRYGVTVNCLAPNARTRMTEDTRHGRPPEGFDPLDPEHVAARRRAGADAAQASPARSSTPVALINAPRVGARRSLLLDERECRRCWRARGVSCRRRPVAGRGMGAAGGPSLRA